MSGHWSYGSSRNDNPGYVEAANRLLDSDRSDAEVNAALMAMEYDSGPEPPPYSYGATASTDDAGAGYQRSENEARTRLLPPTLESSYSGAATLGTQENREFTPRLMSISSLTIAVYIVMCAYSIDYNGGIEPMATNPMVGPSAITLSELGANNAAEIKYRGEYWRFITPIFLHAGVIHLFFNCYVQWRIGGYLEFQWGVKNWLAIYLMGGILGNVGSAVCMPTVIGVGASGSILGLLGGWFVEMATHWHDDQPENFRTKRDAELARANRKRNMMVVFVNVLITFLLSIVPMVDWAAHVFGCIGGMCVAAMLFAGDIRGDLQSVITFVTFVVVLVVLLVGGVTYFFAEVQPCTGNHGKNSGGNGGNLIPPDC